MPNTSSVIQKIRKRDGRVVDFEPDRITLAAGKALKASGTANDKLAVTICKDVLSALDEKALKPALFLILNLSRTWLKIRLSSAAFPKRPSFTFCTAPSMTKCAKARN